MHDEQPNTDVGDPYNFCDRACERCPVARTCAVWLFEQNPEAAIAAMRAGGEGDDVVVVREDEPLTRPPRPVLAERLERAAWEHTEALRALFPTLMESDARRGRAPSPDAESVVRASILVPMKIARLGCFVRPDGSAAFDPIVLGDAAANLILLERVDAELGEALERLGARRSPAAGRYRRARAVLWRLLAPLQASLPPEPRLQLQVLVARGAAPSPFCVRPAQAPARRRDRVTGTRRAPLRLA